MAVIIIILIIILVHYLLYKKHINNLELFAPITTTILIKKVLLANRALSAFKFINNKLISHSDLIL